MESIHDVAMGLGQATQTLWQSGPWWSRPSQNCGNVFGLVDPNLAARWAFVVQDNVGMGLGWTTQTSWQDGPWWSRPNTHYWNGFGLNDPNQKGRWALVYQTQSTMWGLVWVERPKPRGRMGSWSTRAHPQCGDGFGSTDSNLAAGWALVVHT